MSYAAPLIMSYAAPLLMSYAALLLMSYAAPLLMSYAAPLLSFTARLMHIPQCSLRDCLITVVAGTANLLFLRRTYNINDLALCTQYITHTHLYLMHKH